MNDLVRVPPALMLRQLAFVMRASRALYVAARLGVADILASGPMSSAGSRPQQELMRRPCAASCAPSWRTASSRRKHQIDSASTRRANCWARDVPGSQRAGVLFTAGDMRWQLWSDLLECVRTGRAAIERAFGKKYF